MSQSNGAIAQGFVLDCCVVMAWYFIDEQSDYADEILALMHSPGAVVPQHWRLEIANTILGGERRKRTMEAHTSSFLIILDDYSVEFDAQTDDYALTETLRLGRLHKLSAYDAAYLELALRLHLPLATLDQPLAKAATLAGVALFQPPKPTP